MARTYTPQEKARVLGAIAATVATSQTDTPDFQTVATAEGVPYGTARSWWQRSSKEARSELVAQASRVKARLADEAAADTLRAMQTRYLELVQAQLRVGLEDARPDQAWRALEIAGRILRDHAASMGLAVVGESLAADLEDEMRTRLVEAGMIQDSEEEE